MSRRKKRKRSRILRPLAGILAWTKAGRQAFQNLERNLALKRNLRKLFTLRTIVPPVLMAVASFTLAGLATRASSDPLDAATHGTGFLSAALDGIHFWHRIDGSYLEEPGSRLHLYGAFAWSLGLVLVSYLTACYLNWMRAKWIRSLVVLGLVPLVYWVTPLATIVGLAFFRNTSLLQEQAGVGFVLACALPAMLVVCSADRCLVRFRLAGKPPRTPVWIDLGCVAVTLLAGASFGYLMFANWSMSTDTVLANYRATTATSIHELNLPIARIATQRLADIGEGSSRDRFLAAQVSALAEDTKTATEQMQALASQPDGGYSMAHLWLAQRLIAEKSYLTSRAKTDQLLEHLDLGVQRGTHDAETWLEVEDAYYDAKVFLANFRLERARSNSALGDAVSARREGTAARRHFQDLVADEPGSIEFALQLIECHFVMEDFAAALPVLQSAKQIPAEVFKTTVSRLYVAWYDALSQQAPNQRAQRLEVLKRGLDHEPKNSQMLSRLSSLVAEPGIDDREATEMLDDARQLGPLPAGVHFVLGGQAAGKNDLRTALAHYEQANSLEPDRWRILNSLAACIGRMKQPDLERALEFSNRAVELAPEQRISLPLETRGQIHLTLAKAYEQIGKAKQAAEHRRRAKEDATQAKRRS